MLCACCAHKDGGLDLPNMPAQTLPMTLQPYTLPYHLPRQGLGWGRHGACMLLTAPPNTYGGHYMRRGGQGLGAGRRRASLLCCLMPGYITWRGGRAIYQGRQTGAVWGDWEGRGRLPACLLPHFGTASAFCPDRIRHSHAFRHAQPGILYHSLAERRRRRSDPISLLPPSLQHDIIYLYL